MDNLHGLTEQEYETIKSLIGREPNDIELGIFGVLWSEHCSYKSSKPLLKRFPTEGPYVVQGPGENAGVIELEDVFVAFKIESHNHPSFIDPFNGAATGVGGIIRDIISMGARPIALLDSLRFGDINQSKRITKGVVKGISHYGNCIGIPTVGGETFFDECYNKNPLVNVFCIGVMPKSKIYKARATKVGQLLFLIGSSTGRDGIHGATMASSQFDEKALKRRSNVQIGDPFYGKKLLESIMYMVDKDLPIGIQDLGAGGIAGACFEIAYKSNMGVDINLDEVPLRENDMNAYEILLSESQERMLIVIEKENLQELINIASKFHLSWCVLGETTTSNTVNIYFKGERVASLDYKIVAEGVPSCYVTPSKTFSPSMEKFIPEKIEPKELFIKVISNPNIASKEHIYTQYDFEVGTNTVLGPSSDGAVLRIKWPLRPEIKSNQGIAIKADGNPYYMEADPYEGARWNVAECVRNLACVGAKAIAFSDCLNFGNPRREDVAIKMELCVNGMADAMKEFSIPVISGNVSLYNETVEGSNIVNVMPTPVIVGVGLLEDVHKHIDHRFKKPSSLFLIGNLNQEYTLNGSLVQKILTGSVRGALTKVDIEKEKLLTELVIKLIKEDLILSAHDVSMGGLITNIFESLVDTNLGANVSLYVDEDPTMFLFAENPTRVVVSVEQELEEQFKNMVEQTPLDWMLIGNITNERSFIIEYNGRELVSCDLETAKHIWKNSLKDFF
ncbi:phosphoribosylformylglycinamidine synthase subunit PurL [Hydrogenobaculum acidophilum]